MHILLINPVLGHCCSYCFQQAKPPAKVTDLTRDLRDGQVLLTLMEVLFGVKVTRAEPTSKRINQIKNVQEAMSILLQNNVCKPVSDIVTTKGNHPGKRRNFSAIRCIHFGITGDQCNLIGSSYNNNTIIIIIIMIIIIIIMIIYKAQNSI